MVPALVAPWLTGTPAARCFSRWQAGIPVFITGYALARMRDATALVGRVSRPG
jgi:hypothetical protein